MPDIRPFTCTLREPPALEAMRVPTEPAQDHLTAIMMWANSHGVDGHWRDYGQGNAELILPGAGTAGPGQWVIKGTTGAFFIRTDDEFHRAYALMGTVSEASDA